MNRTPFPNPDAEARQSPEVLLAFINRQLEVISERQHHLARCKSLLQEQATRLRLGVSPAVILAVLKETGMFEPAPIEPPVSAVARGEAVPVTPRYRSAN